MKTLVTKTTAPNNIKNFFENVSGFIAEFRFIIWEHRSLSLKRRRSRAGCHIGGDLFFGKLNPRREFSLESLTPLANLLDKKLQVE